MKPPYRPDTEETISKVASLAFAVLLMATLMYLLITRQWVVYAFATMNIIVLGLLAGMLVKEMVRHLYRKG